MADVSENCRCGISRWQTWWLLVKMADIASDSEYGGDRCGGVGGDLSMVKMVVVLVGRRGDCKYGGANVVVVSGDGKCSDSECVEKAIGR